MSQIIIYSRIQIYIGGSTDDDSFNVSFDSSWKVLLKLSNGGRGFKDKYLEILEVSQHSTGISLGNQVDGLPGARQFLSS